MNSAPAAPPSDTPSLFENLGQAAGLARILDVQFEYVMRDQHLREYFLDVELAPLKTSLTAFLRRAFGDASAAYGGPPLHAAHKGQLVTELAFDTFVDLFVAAAAEVGVDVDTQVKARAVLKAMRASVITEFKPNPAYSYSTRLR